MRRKKTEFLLGGTTPIAMPFVHVHDGNRRLRANDKWAIARAYDCFADPTVSVVLADWTGVLVRVANAKDDYAACCTALELLKQKRGYRRLPDGGVIALTNFFPTGEMALAMCGVRVLFPLQRIWRDVENREQNLADSWLGWGSHRRRRTLLLPTWNYVHERQSAGS